MRSRRLYGIVTTRLLFVLLAMTCLSYFASAQKTTEEPISSSTLSAFKEYVESMIEEKPCPWGFNLERINQISRLAYRADLDQIAKSAIGHTLTSYNGVGISQEEVQKVLKGILAYQDEVMTPLHPTAYDRACFSVAVLALHCPKFGQPLPEKGDQITLGEMLSNIQTKGSCYELSHLSAELFKLDGLTDVHTVHMRGATHSEAHMMVTAKVDGYVCGFDPVNLAPMGEGDPALLRATRKYCSDPGIIGLLHHFVKVNYLPEKPSNWWLGGHSLPANEEGKRALQTILASLEETATSGKSSSAKAVSEEIKYLDPLVPENQATRGNTVAYRVTVGPRSRTAAHVSVPTGTTPHARIFSVDAQGVETPVKFLDGSSWFSRKKISETEWELRAVLLEAGNYRVRIYYGPDDTSKLDLQHKTLGKQELRVLAAASNTGEKR